MKWVGRAPTIRRGDDGKLTLDWHGQRRPDAVVMTPEALEQLVNQLTDDLFGTIEIDVSPPCSRIGTEGLSR